MIPRDGGNTFSGSGFVGYQNKSFQSNNLTDDLKKRGLSTPDGIDKLSNFEGSVGGPIMKDRVWFAGSARSFHLDTLPADAQATIPGSALPNKAPIPSGEPGVDPQSITSFQARHRLADQPVDEVQRLQRPYPEEPWCGDGRRLRSGHGVAALELADLHHRVDQGDVDRVESRLLVGVEGSRPTTSATTSFFSRAIQQHRGTPE